MQKYEKILLTGASGLLGSNLAEELCERGYRLKIIVRKTSNLDCLQNLKYELYTGDILNQGDIMNAAEGCSAIIHAASITTQYPVDFGYYARVNVGATLNLLHAVKKLRIRRFIYVSTANTFGFGTKEDPGNELSCLRSEGYESGYIMSKYLAQQYVLREAEKNKLPAIVVNPGFMVGYNVRKLQPCKMIQLGLNNVVICPPGGKSFIYVKDVAKAICNSLIMGDAGECYLLTNENLSYFEFFQLLNRITGNKSSIIKAPSLILKAAGLAGSLFEFATRIPVPLNYINSKLLCHNHFYSSQKAVRELKLPQTPLIKVLPETIGQFIPSGRVLNNLKEHALTEVS